MRILMHILLAGALLESAGSKQATNEPAGARERTMFATNRFVAKGGLGIVSPGLYIVVKSARNELRVGGNESWSGHDASTAEMVVFFGGRVSNSDRLPKGFDLSKAVVVSFEGDKVRFFDFQNMSGGYYDRPLAPQSH